MARSVAILKAKGPEQKSNVLALHKVTMLVPLHVLQTSSKLAASRYLADPRVHVVRVHGCGAAMVDTVPVAHHHNQVWLGLLHPRASFLEVGLIGVPIEGVGEADESDIAIGIVPEGVADVCKLTLIWVGGEVEGHWGGALCANGILRVPLHVAIRQRIGLLHHTRTSIDPVVVVAHGDHVDFPTDGHRKPREELCGDGPRLVVEEVADHGPPIQLVVLRQVVEDPLERGLHLKVVCVLAPSGIVVDAGVSNQDANASLRHLGNLHFNSVVVKGEALFPSWLDSDDRGGEAIVGPTVLELVGVTPLQGFTGCWLPT
mmetsp:Transcript_32331/g.86654  ORF Transcript_32331/g.86654 Transcript_32331/m.86654 type:complete len:316 (+) Transcript_32331:365-1312(+)